MRTIRSRDLLDCVVLLGLWPVSWLLPLQFWPAFTHALGRIHRRLRGGSAGHLDHALLARLGVSADELETGFRQHNYWELMEILREHAPWGWHTDVAIVGRQYIDEAQAAGKGAVLWYCPFTHADVVFKKGLHQAGFRVNHLSALTHGFSDTRFGVAVLNPIKTTVESRYLKDRCIMGNTGVGQVIRGLLDRLRQNQLVSVTALHTGKYTGVRPLFGGTLTLAKGAANFALSTGAALIPIFVVPVDGGYSVHVEPPLHADSAEIDVAEEELISAYLPILERYVEEFPSLWRGWLGPPSYWSPRSVIGDQ